MTKRKASDDLPHLISSKSNTQLDKTLSHSVSITNVANFDNNPSTDDKECKNVAPQGPFAETHVNLCSASLGAKVLFATDEWFATADNLLKDVPPQFDLEAYCEQGKVMDGWESRRRREAGHDWCLIKINDAPISAVEIDTAHFTGNNSPEVSIEIGVVHDFAGLISKLPNGMERLVHGGVQGTGHTPQEVASSLQITNKMVQWTELLPRTALGPGFEPTRMHYFNLPESKNGNIIRFNYFPDGGVARLKLWTLDYETKCSNKPLYMPIETGPTCTVVSHTSGEPLPSLYESEFTELSAQAIGGQGVSCSNKHYGEPWRLTQASISQRMDDGWETARHPSRPGVLVKNPETNLIDSPLNDWCILKLGKPATNGVSQIILDTRKFLGNYPESVMLEGCSSSSLLQGDDEETAWFPLLQRTRMSPDSEHLFRKSEKQLVNTHKPVTHVRLSIFPDGGVSRVRVYG